MLALLFRANSISLALDLALKTSVLTFVRSDPYGHYKLKNSSFLKLTTSFLGFYIMNKEVSV